QRHRDTEIRREGETRRRGDKERGRQGEGEFKSPCHCIPPSRRLLVSLSPCLLVFLSLAVCLCGSEANSFSQTQERQAQGGASTAGAFKPVKDSSARPITAGGFVDGAPVYFADVTARAGLQKFRHVSGVTDKRYILESPSGGVALFDYDNDGWLDIYLVNGS